jgi:hypothetical protein
MDLVYRLSLQLQQSQGLNLGSEISFLWSGWLKMEYENSLPWDGIETECEMYVLHAWRLLTGKIY